MPESYDAIVVGAGPNGLAAAVDLAAAGRSVLVVEANPTVGGGARTEERTLPGFRHDVCSAIHPLGRLSPYFQSGILEKHGVSWIDPPIAVAHPLDDGTAGSLVCGLDASCARQGRDRDAWRDLFAPFEDAAGLFSEILKPLRVPRKPITLARFGLLALQSAERLIGRFSSDAAKSVFAGCAAHAIMPLEATGTASFGMVLAIAAHAVGWPLPRGGSNAIIDALVAELGELGGTIRTGERVTRLDQLPDAKAIVFDVMPRRLAQIAGDALPASYRTALERYRHGPGIFKVDWALDGPIPWTAEECRQAGTVHVGGTYDEVAAAERAAHEGWIPDQPFVLVAQQSLFDPTRAPPGKHTGWAYCHVPNGSRVDMTDAIERQIERFAPGFRERILARSTIDTAALETRDANFIGGDIGGGENDLYQTLARPFLRADPYATPNPKLFLASSATPPGGGVHGMCGRGAAHAALRTVLA